MGTVFRITFLAVLLLALTGAGAGVTSYNISVDGNTAHINVSFELYTSTPGEQVTYWQTAWSPPAHSTIQRIEDSQGVIEDYTYDGDTVRFETNRGPPREKEVVNLQLVTDSVDVEEYNGLDLVKLQLSGFSDRRDDVPDEVTHAVIRTDEQLLTVSQSPGYDYQLDDREALFEGEGPLNLHMTISDRGNTYKNYVLFGKGNLSEADDMYWLVPALTGFNPQQNRYPVVVLPDSEYDQKVDAWSSGQYRTGGIIFLRERIMEKEQMPAILLHETMHGFNEHALKWSDSGLTWFDEGTAKYLESVVKHEKELRQPELFGEPVEWTGSCKDQRGRCAYTINPRGTPDQLWNYYENGDDWMYRWSPQDVPSETERVFGYAYAELLIRTEIQDSGFDALHPVYAELLDRAPEDAGTPQDETAVVLDQMGRDFTPCYDEENPSRDTFKSCLDQANRFDPDVPDTVTVQNISRSIDIQPIERPEPSSALDRLRNTGTDRDSLQDVAMYVLYEIRSTITKFFNNLFKRT